MEVGPRIITLVSQETASLEQLVFWGQEKMERGMDMVEVGELELG